MSHPVLSDGRWVGCHLCTFLDTLQTASIEVPFQVDTATMWQKNSANCPPRWVT